MSSPGEGIGVLRELPQTKNLATLDPSSQPWRYAAKKQQQQQPLGEENKRPASFAGGEASPQKPRRRLAALDRLIDKRPRKRSTAAAAAVSAKRLEAQMSKYLENSRENVAVVESSSISKMLGLLCLANNKELEACCHLIESHATCLRQQILCRNIKSKVRHSVLNEAMMNNLDPQDLDIDRSYRHTNPKTLLSTLEEFPSDWNIVQITAEHEHLNSIRQRVAAEDSMYTLKPMHSLHVISLPTGKDAIHPICITLPKPNSSSSYDIRLQVESLLNNNKSDLTACYNNNDLYWKMRKKQNERMSTAISELEFSWLREWRILFVADYIESLDLVTDIHNMIDKLIADSSIKDMPERTRWLLKKIATGACFLKSFEIERAVKYVLPKQAKLAKNIILSIVGKVKVMEPLKTAKRKPLILIVDECLDHISFESMKLQKHQPVTRFPSLHIAYALYKQHKDTIENGYKIIRKTDNLGTFIVNPSLDLGKMELRIRTFIDYWLPKWEGLYGVKPELEFFKNALTKYSLLMYNGHGSGIQFLRGEEIEKLRVIATVLLFGCSSIKLIPVGGRLPAYGISNQYLMGCSPCILGMLWEVTDGDIDRMTAEFMSSWIKSSAQRAWSDVKLNSWNGGVLEFNNGSRNEMVNEPNMLIAVAKSKDTCKQYMTSAAIIVRGLPVKIEN